MKITEHGDYAVSRAAEKLRQSEYTVTATDFFTPEECAEIERELHLYSGDGSARCFFWGGCRGCERKAAVFLPEWAMPEDAPKHAMPLDREREAFFATYLAAHPEIAAEIPLLPLRIRGSGFRELSHRDYMGSILSLGVDRAVIGEIAVVSPKEAVVFVAERIADYLLTELAKIGRDGVVAERVTVEPTWEVPRSYDESVLQVSSPRLDGIVRAVTGKSREEAAALVRSGLVELNYKANDNVSAEVGEDDILSVRGYGKYRIGKTDGETRSGRLKIHCLKYR